MIKTRFLYLFIIILYSTIWLYLKVQTGYFTPDELFYTSQSEYLDDLSKLSLNFYITREYFTCLYWVNQYLPILIQVFLVLIVFSYIIKKIKSSQSLVYLLFVFILPSVTYFSISYLRDVYALLMVFVFLFCDYDNSKTNKIFHLSLLLMIFLLRYEFGVLLILLYFGDRYLRSIYNVFIRNKYSFLFVYFVFVFLVGVFIVSIDWLWSLFCNIASNYEKTTNGFGYFQKPFEKIDFIVYYSLNIFAYYGPYIFQLNSNKVLTNFDYIMVLDSAICLFIFSRMFLTYQQRYFNADKKYRISIYMVFFTIPFSLIESVPSTSIRHRLIPLAFLLYVNIVSIYRRKI